MSLTRVSRIGSIATISTGESGRLRKNLKTVEKRKALHDDKDKKHGNFPHLHKPTKTYDFEEARKGEDPLFHVDVAAECTTYFKAQRVRIHQKRTEHFAFIVDLDDYEYHKVVFHHFLNEVLGSTFFRIAILCLVLINSLSIGIQTNRNVQNAFSKYFHIIDQVILSIFVFEIIIKWTYDFRLFWRVGWNILDFTIIFLIMAVAVLPDFGWGQSILVAVVRVVRTFRSLRSVSFLSSLSVVSRTIIRSVREMGNILIVLMIFMLVMSLMGVIIFEYPDLNSKRFLDAADAWYLLFICVTQDGWNNALSEFRGAGPASDPEKYYLYMAIYLIIGVSVGAFVFANLIVAVIVANLELSVKEMREEQTLEENPLDIKATSPTFDVLPVYDLLAKSNIHLLSQRPMRIPNLRKFSQRRFQAYINLIVALEQNMIEAEIIRQDLEKIMAVLLSLQVQLDISSQQQAVDNELNLDTGGAEALEKSKRMYGQSIRDPKKKRQSLWASNSETSVKFEGGATRDKEISEMPEVDPTTTDLAAIRLMKNRTSREEPTADMFFPEDSVVDIPAQDEPLNRTKRGSNKSAKFREYVARRENKKSWFAMDVELEDK